MWNAAAADVADYVASRGVVGASLAELLLFVHAAPPLPPGGDMAVRLALHRRRVARTAGLGLIPDGAGATRCLATRYPHLALHDTASCLAPLLESITTGGLVAVHSLPAAAVEARRAYLIGDRLRQLAGAEPERILQADAHIPDRGLFRRPAKHPRQSIG